MMERTHSSKCYAIWTGRSKKRNWYAPSPWTRTVAGSFIKIIPLTPLAGKARPDSRITRLAAGQIHLRHGNGQPDAQAWSDGRWNKLTLAHGCYWGKCAFCDGSLDYIKRYEPNTAKTLVDRMERLIEQTGEIGFHFVDEAAPPALLREMAQEIIRRGITVVWWGNIRFEKSYTEELCDLLQRSGCIAVSGGLEVASPRLLKLINKGVTVAQVARVANNFTGAGIMVHAYLMYGFPTQTAQETIDSLETVRQMFELGLIQSGFWHRFAMTAHSPVGLHPAEYSCRVTEPPFGGFARNDVQFEALSGCDPELFSEGLRVFPLQLHEWNRLRLALA